MAVVAIRAHEPVSHLLAVGGALASEQAGQPPLRSDRPLFRPYSYSGEASR